MAGNVLFDQGDQPRPNDRWDPIDRFLRFIQRGSRPRRH